MGDFLGNVSRRGRSLLVPSRLIDEFESSDLPFQILSHAPFLIPSCLETIFISHLRADNGHSLRVIAWFSHCHSSKVASYTGLKGKGQPCCEEDFSNPKATVVER